MNKIFFTLLVCVVSSLFAVEPEKIITTQPKNNTPYRLSDNFTVDVSIESWSEFVRNSTIIHDSPSFQTNVKVTGSDDLYIDLRLYTKMDLPSLDDNGYGNELDITIGRVVELDNRMVVDFGYAYFDTYKIGKVGDDIFQLFAEISQEVVISDMRFTPFFRAEIHEGVDSKKDIDTSYFSLGGRSVMDLDEIKIKRSLVVEYDTGGSHYYDSGFFIKYLFDVGLHVSDQIFVSPVKIEIVTPFGTMDDGRESYFVFGAGVSASF